MTRTLIGIPLYKPYRSFLESLRRFLTLTALSHDIELYTVGGKTLVGAQNEIVEYFLNRDFTHLLFLENDHSGHTLAMLESLFKPRLPIVAINYYKRHFPFSSCLFTFTQENVYKNFAVGTKGYHECKLIPFGMTLIERDTFKYLEKPYFRLNIEEGQESISYPDGKPNKSFATDRNFCERLIGKGIHPVGCFDHILTHRDINEDTLWDCRSYGIKLYKDWKDLSAMKEKKSKKFMDFNEYWRRCESNFNLSRYRD